MLVVGEGRGEGIEAEFQVIRPKNKQINKWEGTKVAGKESNEEEETPGFHGRVPVVHAVGLPYNGSFELTNLLQ